MTNPTEVLLTWKDLQNPGPELSAAHARRAGRLRRLIEDAAKQPIPDLFHAEFNPAGDPAKEAVFWCEFIAHKLLTAATMIALRESDEVRYFEHQRLMDDARGLADADCECCPRWTR